MTTNTAEQEERGLSLRNGPDEPRPANPSMVIEEQKGTLLVASSLAKDVANIVRENGLSRRFGGAKEHVYVEGWLTIARVQNEQPHVRVEEVIRDEHGNETIRAKGWLTDRNGSIVSEADGYCSTEEPNWRGKPFYARASMAQTRAIAKAMRLRHALVMVMAGYDPTPAEEIEALENGAGPAVGSQKGAQKADLQVPPYRSYGGQQAATTEDNELSQTGVNVMEMRLLTDLKSVVPA